MAGLNIVSSSTHAGALLRPALVGGIVGEGWGEGKGKMRPEAASLVARRSGAICWRATHSHLYPSTCRREILVLLR